MEREWAMAYMITDYCLECDTPLDEDDQEFCTCGSGPYCSECIIDHEDSCDLSDPEDDWDDWFGGDDEEDNDLDDDF
jgi:hypothetical protein